MQSVSMSYLQDGVLKVVCDSEKRLKRVPAAALQTSKAHSKRLTTCNTTACVYRLSKRDSPRRSLHGMYTHSITPTLINVNN